jgi:hypothetical protein
MLTRAGLVSRVDLARVVKEKVEHLLGDALAWPEGRFFFDRAAASRRAPAVEAAVDLGAFLAARGCAEDDVEITDGDVIEVLALEGVARWGGGRRRTVEHQPR